MRGDDDKKIRDALGSIPGVGSVKTRVADAKGEIVYMLSPKGNDDLRGPIFQAAVTHALPLLELERRAEGLEQVFRDLTTDVAAPVNVPKSATRDEKKDEARRKKAERDAAREEAERDAQRAAADSDDSDDDDEEDR